MLVGKVRRLCWASRCIAVRGIRIPMGPLPNPHHRPAPPLTFPLPPSLCKPPPHSLTLALSAF
jgi:hypothetical protein